LGNEINQDKIDVVIREINQLNLAIENKDPGRAKKAINALSDFMKIHGDKLKAIPQIGRPLFEGINAVMDEAIRKI